jgi:hypothetical protein
LKIGLCGTRALPRLGNIGLKSGKNGHLARPNGAVDGPYCLPTWPSVCRRRREPLIGRGGAPAPSLLAAEGASSIVNLSGHEKRAVSRASPDLARKACLKGVAEQRPMSPEGAGGERPLVCHGPSAAHSLHPKLGFKKRQFKKPLAGRS